jgi:O-antigen ligase
VFEKSSKILIYLFVFSIPWADVIPIFSGSVPSLVGIFLVPLSFVAMLKEIKPRHYLVVHFIVFCFFTWIICTFFWSADQSSTLQRISTYAQLVFFVFLYYQICKTNEDVQNSLLALLLGLFFTSIACIYSWTQGALAIQAYDERYSSFNADPNDLALSLALGIPLAFYLCNSLRSIKSYLFLSYVPVSLFAIALTGSRSGLICALAASLFVIPSWPALPRAIRLLLIGTVVFGAVLAFEYIPENALLRFSQIPSQLESLDLTNRVDLWQGGVTLFLRNIVFGIGAGAYRSEVSSVVGFDNVAHNTPLSLLAETGLIGFLLFYVLVVWIFRRLKLLDPYSKMFWVWSFLVLGIGTFGLTWEYRKIPWLLFAMAISHVMVIRNEKKAYS